MIIGAVTLRLISRLAWHVHVRTNKWAYALERVELKLEPNQMPRVHNVRIGGASYAADEVPGYLVPVSWRSRVARFFDDMAYYVGRAFP